MHQVLADRDVADYFLFDLQSGYCDYYATTMVVMARSLGIPARLAIGYASGDYDPQEGVFVVTEDPLPEEAEVHLLITFPGSKQPLSTIGVVSHTVVPEDEDTPGMGIVFSSRDAERKLLVEAVDRLDQAFRTGSLPDDVLL